MKLWAGRFQKETDDKVNDFNSSISFDARLYRQDITGSIAHATMLGGAGDHRQGRGGKDRGDPEGSSPRNRGGKGGIHQGQRGHPHEHGGPAHPAHRRHRQAAAPARSRNDQVALDFRLFVKEEIPVIVGMLLNLEKALIRQAEGNLDAIMPGYTHLQRAQPITFAHAMMAYANMFRRDITRLEDCRPAGRVPPGFRGPGHLHPSGGPVPHGGAPGLSKAHGQLPGRGVRPGLCH